MELKPIEIYKLSLNKICKFNILLCILLYLSLFQYKVYAAKSGDVKSKCTLFEKKIHESGTPSSAAGNKNIRVISIVNWTSAAAMFNDRKPIKRSQLYRSQSFANLSKDEPPSNLTTTTSRSMGNLNLGSSTYTTEIDINANYPPTLACLFITSPCCRVGDLRGSPR